MKTKRIVVVTGAAGGIGSELVQRFLGNGDTVIATDSTAEALEKLKTKLGDAVGLHSEVADVSDEGSCNALADFARDKTNRVDVLINCAGWFPMTPFAELTAQMWRKIVDVNLTGPFLMIKAMYPLIKGRGWGRIVNIGSGSAFEGVAGQAPYVAAKAGIFGLSRSLAREFGGDGVTVNVVTPGLTTTPPVRANMPPDFVQSQTAARALSREEQAEDLVGAVFFLASPDADFITGQTINVDGGKHML